MNFDESISLISVDLGDAVTLQCTTGVKYGNDLILWYKQKLGAIPQVIGMTGLLDTKIIFPPFNETAFLLDRAGNIHSLNILHVTKDDEAMYFCGKSQVNVIEFFSGTVLSVKGKISLFMGGLYSCL